MINIILSSISLTIFLTYVIYVLIKYGVPTSLSESAYLMKSTRYFTIMMFLIGFTVLPALFNITPDNGKFAAFFLVLGILFTGAAPLFKDSQKTVHYVSAGISAAFSLLWIILVSPFQLITYLIILSGALLLNKWDKKRGKDNTLFWIEFAIFSTTYLTILIRSVMLYGNH